MGGSKQQQACMECTKKCLKIHGKRPSSSTVAAASTQASFFKVMIGDFKGAMFLPPKIAHTFGDLVNEEIYLEDPNGHTWRVRISVICGSLAFRQGWCDFVIDHNIKHGELVVFKYTSRSLFSVQIFSTSACERLNFTEKNNNKQHKRKRSKSIYLPSEKNNRSSDKHYPVNENSEKQDMALQTIHKAIQIAAENHVAKVTGDVLTAPLKSPHCDDSIRPQTKSIINYHEAPCDRNAKNALKVEEAVKVSVFDFCNDEDIIDSVSKLNSLSYIDNPNSCLVEYVSDKKEDLVASNMLISSCPLTEKHTSISQHSEVPYNMIPGSSMFEPGVTIITPDNPPDPGTTETQFCSKEIDRLLANVDEKEQLCPHDSHKRSQAASVAEYTLPETKNQIDDCWAVVTNPLSVKELSMVDCNNCINGATLAGEDWIRKQEVDNIFDLFKHETECSMLDVEEIFSSSPPFNYNKYRADDGGNLIAQNQVVDKCVISDQGTSYNAGFATVSKTVEHRDALTSFCNHERDGSVHSVDNAAIKIGMSSVCEDNLEVPTGEPIFKCAQVLNENLMPFLEPINSVTRNEENWGNKPTKGSSLEDASMVKTIGSDPINITVRSESPKDPVDKERNFNQTEVDGRKVDFCLQKKAIVPKTEVMDAIDFPSPTYANFRFSVSVNAQSWLKLPERLPSCVAKKKLERRVVTLRDPIMRAWPVLYHENKRFVGFVSGWEEFATANNLQKGDICQFELANELEPTFQLRASGASK